MNGRVERMQATWRYEFYAVYDPPRHLKRLNPLIDAFAHRYNTYRPHDALDQLAPSQYVESLSVGRPPRSHMC
ncbi:MAG TPA: integrase core domain-containing protein [Paracoccaceae bacterium]|nr:integrase core domain-containing protein [Paracoccaceae bacterium]